MNELTIKPAVRTGIKPLVGFYGRSGGGKTRSALLLARGIVGPTGRIVLVDTESGRGSIFADKIPGGYSVIDLEPPFTPGRYAEAFKLAEANADILIVDSLSHCWSGEDGVLDWHEKELDRMAGDDWRKREACSMSAWIKPKAELKKLVQSCILRTKLPVICCLRGEIKTRVGKNEQGKTKISADEWSSPIFDPRFLFELLVCAECYSVDGKGGYLHVTKITHEDLFQCLPAEGEQVGIKHGELLSKWSLGGQQSAMAPAPSPVKTTQAAKLKELKRALWTLTAPIHNCQASDSPAMMELGRQRLEQWLWDESILSDSESLAEVGPPRLVEIVTAVEKKLSAPSDVNP